MPLTIVKLKSIKPQKKAFKLFDGEGMFLYVTPEGKMYWRLKYRYAGKEKLLAIGVFPKTGLKEARELRDEAKNLLKQGKDPSELRKIEKIKKSLSPEYNFEAVAREWHKNNREKWSEKHAENILRKLETDIFLKLGHRDIREITAPELLSVLRAVEARGPILKKSSSASRLPTYMKQNS